MSAYYNEIDPHAAAWLRELIKQGHIADGEVDERSIEDVLPDDLREFRQCHFFAGIGTWSYALRQAGWPDDREVWTGSCPCQPFSTAGKGGGVDDERHLWPAQHYLIEQREPSVWFGEQVASKDGLGWLDTVQADMEGTGYACGAIVSPACGFGAPHIRKRQYIAAQRMADASELGQQRSGHLGQSCDSAPDSNWQERGTLNVSRDLRLGHTSSATGERDSGRVFREKEEGGCERLENGDISNGHSNASSVGGMANADSIGHYRQEETEAEQGCDGSDRGLHTRGASESGLRNTSPTNGFWSNSDWLRCRDDKWRPVESGTFPLVSRPPARVVRLRGYGNGIVAQQAQAFIEAAMSSMEVTA